MSHRIRLLLDDIIEACDLVLEYREDLSREEFQRHRMAFDALVRQLAIIGEASAQLSPDERSRHPQIEWRKFIGLRNIVIHHYFGIDDDIIWDVVQNHVPILRQEVVQILKALPDDETDGS